MKKREAEAGDDKLPPPIAINFNKKDRDSRRQQLSLLFLNMIRRLSGRFDVHSTTYSCAEVVLRERGDETRSKVKTMSWKWADFATKKQLRIENWPTELKTTCPSPGFALASVKGKDETRAMEQMHKALEKAYKGEEEDKDEEDEEDNDKRVRVVSWMPGT